MNKYTRHRAGAATDARQGFTIVETVVTLTVVAILLTMFFQGYLFLVSQRTIAVRQSKADSIARANLQRVAGLIDTSSFGSSCPTTGWDLRDPLYGGVTLDSDSTRTQALGTGSTEQLTLYCVTTSISGPQRVVSKVTYKVNGTDRTVVYAQIFNEK